MSAVVIIGATDVCIMSVWHKVSSSWVGGLPLLGACRAVSELPLVSEQHVEVGVVPLRLSWSPCTSIPLVVSPPTPVPWAFFQPVPCSSISPDKSRSPAPWALPNVCSPAVRAQFPHRSSPCVKVSRMSAPEATGSGFIWPLWVHINETHLHGA